MLWKGIFASFFVTKSTVSWDKNLLWRNYSCFLLFFMYKKLLFLGLVLVLPKAKILFTLQTQTYFVCFLINEKGQTPRKVLFSEDDTFRVRGRLMIQFCRVSTLNVKSWQTGRCDMLSDLCLSKALFFGYFLFWVPIYFPR